MKLLTLLPLLASTSLACAGTIKQQDDIRSLPITRNGTTLILNKKPWKAVGANVYWLGLDENVSPRSPDQPYYAPTKATYPTQGRITEIMAVVKAMGGTMIRSHTLGISVGNPLSLWPAPDQTNEAAFAPIDWAVYQARVYGLRLMVPLIDNFDYYHGGKYTFLRWAGFNLTGKESSNPQVQQFYNNKTIVNMVKRYISVLLTHKNPYTNLTYAEDPTIFAIETGNELNGPVWGDMNVPTKWVREIGQHVKGLAPRKLFVDGTYGVNRTHFAVDEVDIFSNHYYPVSIDKLKKDLNTLSTVDKPYFAGEYGWLGNAASADANLTAWFRELEASPKVIGDTFWSLFGHNVPDCDTFVEHSDGFTMQYGNPAHAAQIKLVRQHFVKMSKGLSIADDETLPSVPCPAPTAR
ncbi:putative mannan endo-1,4-beta-mannosidase P [Podospora australis]|uniref:mannan endo-1,4-beta-mannosidase n=1 Tax=Podospora australis TaxID=1536484 RepID=A0AAN6X1Z0_9PEZI|nr:putative mannan endo-1,4-beta-mannosidase P [Podospora australis]